MQKYIKEENKRKEKEVLFGGLIIKDGNHFRINEDDAYQPFKIISKVRGVSGKYKSGANKIQEGWKYFEIK